MGHSISRSLCVASLLGLFVTPTASAQSWFTRDVCTVTEPAIDDAILPAHVLQKAAEIENGVGRLWKITSPAGKVSHLWGTFHSNNRHILDIPAELRQLLGDARVVALENDPTSGTRPDLLNASQGVDFYRAEAAPDVYADFEVQVTIWITARISAQGFTPETIDWLTPGGLGALVLDDPCNDFAAGVLPIQDFRVLMLGREAGARIVGLEPADAFMKALNDPARLDTAKAMIEGYGAYLNPEGIKEGRSASFALYLQGRIGTLMAWDADYLVDFFGAKKGPELYRKLNGYLVVERNRTFLQSARPLLDQGDAVIAVGAFHLPGPNGLVQLFRQEGYTVERVPVEGEAPG